VAGQKQNRLHLHHDFRERFTGTLINVHSMFQGFGIEEKGVLKKRKKSFGETKKWITFAELSPEKTGEERTKIEHTNRRVH